jgi:cytochrome d ubiquinol oxidase subunit II
MDLVQIWIILVGLVVILYVLLDGFSLGVGILFPFAKNTEEQDIMISTVAPVWDANQTWIVFGGGALFAVFPLLYTVIFSALYVPLFTFLFGLIFRGVALEFRSFSRRKVFWSNAFFAGSFIATFGQGLTLGAYISGIQVKDGLFAGGAFDWLSPFSVMVGFALVAAYALLGATYLILKTESLLQERAFDYARKAVIIVGFFLVVVTIWTPLHDPYVLERWLTKPRIFFIWVFPLLGVLAYIRLLYSVKHHREHEPFWLSAILFLSAYLGLEAALYPYAILPDITIYDAASPTKTLVFTLWGVAIILPFVLSYIAYSYWVFRGKVAPETEGYAQE